MNVSEVCGYGKCKAVYQARSYLTEKKEGLLYPSGDSKKSRECCKVNKGNLGGIDSLFVYPPNFAINDISSWVKA